MSTSKKKKRVNSTIDLDRRIRQIPGMKKVPHLTPLPDKDSFESSLSPAGQALYNFSLTKYKTKQVQTLVQVQADRNRAKVQKRVQERLDQERQGEERKEKRTKKKSKDKFIKELRKHAEQCPIPAVRNSTLDGISKLVSQHYQTRFPDVFRGLLDDVSLDYESSLRSGAVDDMIQRPEGASRSKTKRDDIQEPMQKIYERTNKCAPWHEDFKRNKANFTFRHLNETLKFTFYIRTKKLLANLHVLHPALRQALSLCKTQLNTITLADFNCYNGQPIDLDSFCGNIISECEKTEETLMNTWFKQISAIFDPANLNDPALAKGGSERKMRFYQCASSLLSIQLRDLLKRSVSGYSDIFSDRRKLPRIEVDLVLVSNQISFSPSVDEIYNMTLSVVSEMNKLLREVPTMESWISGTNNSFVPVTLDSDFIDKYSKILTEYIQHWLAEPVAFADSIREKFNFLIDGTAKQQIIDFIATNPKFEEICSELQVYNHYVEKTQEITSLEYFPFIRLDCDNARRGLADYARKLSSLLLKNVVDTYRKENEYICRSYEEIEKIALKAPKSTKEMIDLGEYMLNVKNKKIVKLEEDIEESKKHLLYLIDVHIFSKGDIELNTRTLAWPSMIKPVFEQNTEIIEDCKAKFEDNLQKKSEWVIKELEKLSARVHELEELGEINSVNQYASEVRLIQHKLKTIEETVCWVNEEEALFKFPQSSYQDVGDITTIQNNEGKMHQKIEPYARLFGTVLKWQKAEKKWTDGSFLELNADSIEQDTLAFSEEMDTLQKLFKSKFKQQALDGDSKYAKMNLEDSNPDHLPPPLKICALTSVQIKKFRANIPLIKCLCNQGIRQRHWNQMSEIIGFDITPNSGSSLRKVLKLNLDQYMERLEAVSMSATREHLLEIALKRMKGEWEQISFHLTRYRDSDQKILTGLTSVQSHMEDHLMKIQTMRGSPFFKAFEAEILAWEAILNKIRKLLLEWTKLQDHWLILEPLFSAEDIVLQMPEEANLFKEVDAAWKDAIYFIDQNPNVLKVTQTSNFLESLIKKNQLLEAIDEGISHFMEIKRKTFPRLFFLSRSQLRKVLCETRDAARLQTFIPIIFPGVGKLDMDELHDAHGLMSQNDDERVPFVASIRSRESRGCMEIWMKQIESQMQVSVKEVILHCFLDYGARGCHENTMSVWVQDWPTQALLTSSFVTAVKECMEAIKGGNDALRALKEAYMKHRSQLLLLLKDYQDLQLKTAVTSLLFHDMRIEDIIDDLLRRKVKSEKDFGWRIKPRMYLRNGDISMEIMDEKFDYRYEYQGDSPHLVWTPQFDRAIFTFLTAFKLKYFPCLQGDSSTGKLSIVKETARILAVPLFIRTIGSNFMSDAVMPLLEGVARSGSWLCLRNFDNVSTETLSSLAPHFHDFKEALKAKGHSERSLFGQTDIQVADQSFLIFISSPGEHSAIPSNVKCLMRVIGLVKPDEKMLLRAFIQSSLHSKKDNIDDLVSVMSTLDGVWPKDLRSICNLDQRCLNRIWWRKLADESVTFRDSLLQNACNALPKIEIEKLQSLFNTEQSQFRSDELAMEAQLVKEFQKLGINPEKNILRKAQALVNCIASSRGIALVGRTMTGKSLALQIAGEFLQVKRVVIYIKAVSHENLFGSWTGSYWKDGILTRSNQDISSTWIILTGPMDPAWMISVEKLIDSKSLDLETGEHLILKDNVKIVFETDSIRHCPPSTLSRCQVVYFEDCDLTWKDLFSRWFSSPVEEDSVEFKWKQGQEPLVRSLFDWILPPMIQFLLTQCDSDIRIIPSALFRHTLELFTVTLNEAIPNLKEKKYLRSWIQAAFVFSITWSFGGILPSSERPKFDSFLRDVLMGKSQKNPLPASLNNKFDVVPPTEGTVFDFVFDFKARGQWKQWSDAVKNASDHSILVNHQLFIPTIDSVRFHYLQTISESNKKPFLVYGPSCSGKTTAALAKFRQSHDRSWYHYTALYNSDSRDLSQWMLKKLQKKKDFVYGPASNEEAGSLLLDDLSVVKPGENNVVQLFEMLIQLFDTSRWCDSACAEQITLQDMNLIGCTSSDNELYGCLNDRLLSRFNIYRMQMPSEETLGKFFSTILTAKFKERSFPPEVSSVIPCIVQSTMKVYTHCQSIVLGDIAAKNARNLRSKFFDCSPNLRDAMKIIKSCACLPKESAENKKLFTRLWVHEALRGFYDRLYQSQDLDAIFEDIKSCVKTVFRENFDSAFEHLGKIDGKVTQFNLRNLLFGSFIPGENGLVDRNVVLEVSNFEDFDRLVQKSISEHESNPLLLYRNRFTMEFITQVSHVLSTPNGHALLGGHGGEGRESFSRIAASLSDVRFYSVPNVPNFSIDTWHKDLSELLKTIGCQQVDGAIYVTAHQMQKNSFLLNDILSLFARGDVMDLFSLEEKNEMNEHVHKHLCKDQESPYGAEETPMALFEKFIDICKQKLHILISYNTGDQKALELLHRHRGLVQNCVPIAITDWPSDSLRKSAEQILDDFNIDRNKKKQLIKITYKLYKKAREESSSVQTSLPMPILVSPLSYISFMKNLKSTFQLRSVQLDSDISLYSNAIEKFNEVKEQLVMLSKEKEDLQPAIAELNEKISKVEMDLQELIAEGEQRVAKFNNQAEKVREKQEELEGLRAEYCSIIDPIESGFKDRRRKLQSLKVADLLMSKTLKNGTPPLRACVTALCLIMDVHPDKQNKGAEKTKVMAADFWTPGKRMLMDAAFLERLLQVDTQTIPLQKIKIIQNDIINQSEWDIFQAGKTFPPAETLCQWIATLCTLHLKKEELSGMNEQIAKIEEELLLEEKRLEERKTDLSENNSAIEEQRYHLKKVEEEKRKKLEENRVVSEKTCRGNTLIEKLEDEIQAAEEHLKLSKSRVKSVLLSSLNVAYQCSILCSFPMDMRIQLERHFHEAAKIIGQSNTADENHTTEEEEPITCPEDTFESMLNPLKLKHWKSLGLPAEKYFIVNTLSFQQEDRWPLIYDPDGIASLYIKEFFSNRCIRSLDIEEDSNIDFDTLKSAIEAGEILLLFGVKNYDHGLNYLLRKWIIVTDAGDRFVHFHGQEVKFNTKFQLFMFTSSTKEIDHELFCKCCFIDFSITTDAMRDKFLDVVFEHEEPKTSGTYEQVLRRDVELSHDLLEKEIGMLKSLGSPETNLVDSKLQADKLLSARDELNNLRELYAELTEIKVKCEEVRNKFWIAADHAVLLYKTAIRMKVVNFMYDFSLDWYIRMQKNSIVNSNKCRLLEKRLRYIKDHLTYTLFRHMYNCVLNRDSLTFVFFLSCQLLIEDGHLPQEYLQVFAQLWKFVFTDHTRQSRHPKIPWLKQRTWEFLVICESMFPSLCGLTDDILDKSYRWKILFDAKEPDNLPLHEPWYSKISKFERLVVIAAIRPDKLMELAYSYVYDHIGYKFVENCVFDLGRLFSDGSSSEPIMFIVNGDNNASDKIRKLAKQRDSQVITISEGETQYASQIQSVFDDLSAHGLAWMLVENFHLNPFIQLPKKECHEKFRLWIVTEVSERISESLLKKSTKLSCEIPTKLKEILLHFYNYSDVASILFAQWHSEQSSNVRDLSRLFFCLVFLHATLMARKEFGWVGGIDKKTDFLAEDMDFAVHWLQFLSKEKMASSSIAENLQELIKHCNYGLKVKNKSSRNLIEIITKQCLNGSTVTTNRYRFSSSQDFYVPNKVHLLDYLAHIKSLPAKTDSSLFGLEPSTQIEMDFLESQTFLRGLCLLSSGSQSIMVCREQDLCHETTDLLEVVNNSFVSESQVPQGELNWSEEAEAHNETLSVARKELYNLLGALNGEKTMASSDESLVNLLLSGRVPGRWLGCVCPEKAREYFTSTISERKLFLENHLAEAVSVVPVSILINPKRMLTRLRKRFADDLGCFLQDVGFFANLEDKPDFLFRGLELRGCLFNLTSGLLTPRTNVSRKNILNLGVSLKVLANKKASLENERLFPCPLVHSNHSGDALDYIWFPTVSSEDSLIKTCPALVCSE